LKIEHEQKSIRDLMKLRDDIHLNPAWQRGPVWSATKQGLLIDSILRGYDIPMIYLRECSPPVPFKYEVVDGQQRLRTLWGYIDGDYPLAKDAEKVGTHRIANMKFHALPTDLQKKINNFKVVVAIVKDAREPEISKLFSRMQMGVHLNPPELRNSVQTGLRHAVDGAARLHPFFLESKIPAARFKHQDYLAHAVSMCIHGGTRDLKAGQLMEDYTHITDSSVYSPIINEAGRILDVLKDVNERCRKKIRQKWMFVDLFYLLHQHKSKLKSINRKAFTDCYVDFDERRLSYTSEPERLLDGSPTKREKRPLRLHPCIQNIRR